MDFFLGSVAGFVVGFGLLFIHYHKSVITNTVIALKHDISLLKDKIDAMSNSLHK